MEQAQRIENAHQPHFPKILILRTDRIGDVVLTLPMVAAVKSSDPAATVYLMIRHYTQEIAERAAGVDGLLFADNPEGTKSFWTLLAEVRRERFDAAFLAYPRFRLALILFLAGIKVRVGSGYRWFSFLFSTRVYEHRKFGDKHEAVHNLLLLRSVGFSGPEHPRVTMDLRPEDREFAGNFRDDVGIHQEAPLVLLHPGSGGSARDWPVERFAELARLLVDSGVQVIVTGGKTESKLVEAVTRNVPGVRALAGELNLGQLAALIESADLFVSNSTGPLHIAAAVGTPVVCFYPPYKPLGVGRWGPLTANRRVFVPDAARCERCRGGECEADECMRQIHASDVHDAVMETLKRERAAVPREHE